MRLNYKQIILLFVVLISLLPGIVISASLFVNAVINDINTKKRLDSLPSTDLSQVRIEGYNLDQHITNYKPGENFCTIVFKNGKIINDISNDSDIYTGDSPIVSIHMDYPVIKSYRTDRDGKETWRELTFQNTPIPNFNNAVETLGKNYVYVENGREFVIYRSGIIEYFAFIDRENDIELRFYSRYYEIESSKVELRRIDNRGTMEYFKEIVYGQGSLFWCLYPFNILENIIRLFREHQFLFSEDYFYLPVYIATWVFPLVWAVYKRKSGWTFAACIWYPLWFFYCLFTYSRAF